MSSIYVFSYFPFGFEGRIWDLIVSVPDHCLYFYFADFSHIDIHFSFTQPNSQLYSQQNTGISARDFTTSSNTNEIPSNEDTSRDIELQNIHNSKSGQVSHDDKGSYSHTQQATGRSDYSIIGRKNETVNALKESGSRPSSVCSSKHIDSSGVLRPSIFKPFTSETGASNQDSPSQTKAKHSGPCFSFASAWCKTFPFTISPTLKSGKSKWFKI